MFSELLGVATALADRDKDPKIPGVPTPSNAQQGAGYRGFMDEAFSGTTPWERLGATTGGQPGAALSANSAQGMQEREFKQQRTLHDMTNRANIIASASPGGAVERQSKLMSYLTGSSQGYDTDVAQRREKLPQDIAHTAAQAGHEQAKGDIARAQVPYAGQQAKGEADYASVRPYTAVADAGANVARSINPFGMGIKQVRQFVGNFGRHSRRFGLNDGPMWR